MNISGKSKGWRSSEFLVTCGAMIIACLGVLFEGQNNTIVTALCGLAGIVAPAAYATSRAMVKKALVQSEALTEVAKKKPSED